MHRGVCSDECRVLSFEGIADDTADQQRAWTCCSRKWLVDAGSVCSLAVSGSFVEVEREQVAPEDELGVCGDHWEHGAAEMVRHEKSIATYADLAVAVSSLQGCQKLDSSQNRARDECVLIAGDGRPSENGGLSDELRPLLAAGAGARQQNDMLRSGSGAGKRTRSAIYHLS